MTSIYQSVMDPKHNPLNTLPAAQRFQIMTYLSLMWTTIFCVGSGAWLWYGQLVVLHVALAFGFAITGWVFSNARNDNAQLSGNLKTYRDFPRKDGFARYDDVWGA